MIRSSSVSSRVVFPGLPHDPPTEPTAPKNLISHCLGQAGNSSAAFIPSCSTTTSPTELPDRGSTLHKLPVVLEALKPTHSMVLPPPTHRVEDLIPALANDPTIYGVDATLALQNLLAACSRHQDPDVGAYAEAWVRCMHVIAIQIYDSSKLDDLRASTRNVVDGVFSSKVRPYGHAPVADNMMSFLRAAVTLRLASEDVVAFVAELPVRADSDS